MARLLDRIIIWVVCLSAAGALLETPANTPILSGLLHGLDWAATLLLTVEYLIRLSVAHHHPRLTDKKLRRARFAVYPLSVVDLVAIAASWLSLLFTMHLEILRLLRLLRLIELAHVLQPSWDDFLRRNQGRSLRQKTFSLLNLDDHSGHMHGIIDRTLMALIALSVLLVMLSTVPALQSHSGHRFAQIDTFVVVLFAVEYLARLYAIVENPRFSHPFWGRLRYAVTPGALIDLLALMTLVPWLTSADMTVLRVLRLVRVLKLSRYSMSVALILDVVRAERATLSASFFMLTLVTTFAASGVYLAEHGVQPEKYSSIPMSMYWAVITLTSIGYGDVYPITPMGQFLTMVFAVASLGMIALPAGILANGFGDRVRKVAPGRGAAPVPSLPHPDSPSVSEQADLAAMIAPLGRQERLALLTLLAQSLSEPASGSGDHPAG